VSHVLPYAHGGPPATGVLRAEVDDFRVDEVLGFDPTGSGEHAFLTIEKRGANTEWVARQLARAAGVAPVAVGFAGLKDRRIAVEEPYAAARGGTRHENLRSSREGGERDHTGEQFQLSRPRAPSIE